MPDNIFRFPGGPRGPKKPDEETVPEALPAAEGKAEFDLGRYTEMLLPVHNLFSQVSHKKEIIRTRQELVRGYTDEQIIAIVNTSTSSDWSARPIFYQCVLDEAKKRNLGGIGKFRPDR